MNRVVPLLALLILSAALTPCGKEFGQGQQSRPAPVTGLLIEGAGATFPQPLYARWIEEYGNSHPTAGQADAEAMGYIPLPAVIVAKAKAALDSIH